MFHENTRALFADFGVDVTLNGATVRGIFDDVYGSSFGGMVDADDPTFVSSASATVGMTLTHGSKTYTVRSVEQDSGGFVLLRLK